MSVTKIMRITLWLICIYIGSDTLYSQSSAQSRGVKSQIESIDRLQWQKIRQLQRRVAVTARRQYVKPVPKLLDKKVALPKILSYGDLRFKGRSEAEIDSIKRVDKEKHRFLSDFLGQLHLVASEINTRDSLLKDLDRAILSGDSITDELFKPEFVAYANDAIEGFPGEIALYNSLYDDLNCREDSTGFIGKYRIRFGLESLANTRLINQIYKDSLYSKTVKHLREKLSSDIEQYLYLYGLEPFTVEPDSVEAIAALVPTELYESNRELVRTFAEMAATGNAVYNELRDVRHLRNSTLENASSLYIVRLVEMKLRLEETFPKYRRVKIPDTHVFFEAGDYIRPSWKMGKYTPYKLHRLLSFLLKNEFENQIDVEE